MSNLLRNDGDYTIYVIEFLYQQAATYPKRWTTANPDAFGEIGRAGITASGECWQRTGIMGTFDRGQADYALKMIRKDCKSRHGKKGSDFRVRKFVISQMSMPESWSSLYENVGVGIGDNYEGDFKTVCRHNGTLQKYCRCGEGCVCHQQSGGCKLEEDPDL